MLSPVSDAFLDSVLKRILWRGEHAAIREELSAHLEDHIQALVEQGTDPAEAERRAVAAMGDPAEIGLQLNRQHRPFLGWAVRFTGRDGATAVPLPPYWTKRAENTRSAPVFQAAVSFS